MFESTSLQRNSEQIELTDRFSKGSIVEEFGVAIRSNMKDAIANGTPRLPIFAVASQQDEATAIVSKVAILAQGGGGRIAIFVRKRGALANLITDELTKEGMSYFNGLFSDAAPESLNSMRLLYPGLPRQRLEIRASAGLLRTK